MTWTPSGPGSGNTFEAWASAPAEGAAPPLSSLTTINCWEMVILAAYRAKMVKWQWVHNLYKPSAPVADWGAYLVKTLSSGNPVPYKVGDPNTPQPLTGDIVFFDGAAHVALATGSKSGLKTDIISFWPPPGTAFTPGGTLDRVKTTTIEDLNDWWTASAGWPAPKITFANAAWPG